MKQVLTTKMENADRVNVLVFLQDKIYGNVLYYPGNKAAESIVACTNRKTLLWEHLQKLSEIGGFEIEVRNRY